MKEKEKQKESKEIPRQWGWGGVGGSPLLLRRKKNKEMDEWSVGD